MGERNFEAGKNRIQRKRQILVKFIRGFVWKKSSHLYNRQNIILQIQGHVQIQQNRRILHIPVQKFLNSFKAVFDCIAVRK